MRVAGIDLSTHAVDIVTVPLEGTEAPVWRRFELRGDDSFSRARVVRDAMPPRTDAFYDDILAVGIEDPAGHHGTNHIYRIQGAVLQCLPSLVLVKQWRPAAWKHAVGLKGNANKGQVSQFVVRQKLTAIDGRDANHVPEGALPMPHGVTWPQDACDAYCIALATRQAIHVGAAA